MSTIANWFSVYKSVDLALAFFIIDCNTHELKEKARSYFSWLCRILVVVFVFVLSADERADE